MLCFLALFCRQTVPSILRALLFWLFALRIHMAVIQAFRKCLSMLLFSIVGGLLSFPLGVKQHGFRNNVTSKASSPLLHIALSLLYFPLGFQQGFQRMSSVVTHLPTA